MTGCPTTQLTGPSGPRRTALIFGVAAGLVVILGLVTLRGDAIASRYLTAHDEFANIAKSPKVAGFLRSLAMATVSPPRNEPSASPYLTAPVEIGNITTILKVTGQMQAVVMARVGSQLSGQIEDLLVDFNDPVKKGQIIARLDPRIHEAKVRAAEARLDVAKAQVLKARAALARTQAEVARARENLVSAAARAESIRVRVENLKTTLERKRILAQRRILAQSHIEEITADFESRTADMQAAQSEHRAAESTIKAVEAAAKIMEADIILCESSVKQYAAELVQAQTDLEHTKIRATIDGIVIGRDVEIGQTVATTLEAPTLFFIAQDLRQMEVYARIDEADIGQIQVGQSAKFTVDAYPGRSFKAKVLQIRKAPSVVQNVVTYTVVLSAENADSILLPGMTALVQITVKEFKNVLKVPNVALRFRLPQSVTVRGKKNASGSTGNPPTNGAPVVWVLDEDGNPVPCKVTLGSSDALATEVTEGDLSVGQHLIVGVAQLPSEGWFSLEHWGL